MNILSNLLSEITPQNKPAELRVLGKNKKCLIVVQRPSHPGL